MPAQMQTNFGYSFESKAICSIRLDIEKVFSGCQIRTRWKEIVL